MSRVHYWLLLQVAKAPKAFTYGAGVLITLVLVVASAITIFVVDRAHTSTQHDQAAQLSRAMGVEITNLLEHFQQHSDISCEGSYLTHLNSHLLRAHFVREVGLLDGNSRLLCTTTMGRLPTPIKGNHPVINLPSGREMLIDVPLQVTDKKVMATIFRQGDFNVVVSPNVTEELYASADYIWLRTAVGLTLIRSTQVQAGDLQHYTLEHDDATDQSTWSLYGLGYMQLTAPADSLLVFQTQRSWVSVMQQNSTLLVGMLIMSAVFAALAASALAPRVLLLCGVHNRVQFLCDAEHIQLVYQPIFDLSSKQAVGCEVLMRIHEDKQIWMPDQLIPAIMSLGLTRSYDHVVARKAISELASHLPVQKNGFKLMLNFFPESIDRATLMPVLQHALQSAARDDFQLCIEVTEHSLSSELIAETNSMKAQGVLIAVDDFGTGYSNLKSVATLSPDLLKIDKTFVFDLEEATLRSTIIPQIVDIARAVEAQIIAEGIENLEQVPLLSAMGVHYGQGYALARPMDLQALLAFMSKT